MLLDPGLLILLVSHLCPSLSPLFSPSCILSSISIAILLPGCFGKNGFPGLVSPYILAFLCTSLCALGRNLYIRYIPLPSVSTACFPTCLPTCLQVVSLYILSPLPCFFPGLQHVGLFYSSLSFLTCSSSLSQCLLHVSPHYCCSLWVLLGHRTFIVSSLFPDFAT